VDGDQVVRNVPVKSIATDNPRLQKVRRRVDDLIPCLQQTLEAPPASERYEERAFIGVMDPLIQLNARPGGMPYLESAGSHVRPVIERDGALAACCLGKRRACSRLWRHNVAARVTHFVLVHGAASCRSLSISADSCAEHTPRGRDRKC
jgi:hypothetical protein